MFLYNLVYNHWIFWISGADIILVLFGGILNGQAYQNNQGSYNKSSEY